MIHRSEAGEPRDADGSLKGTIALAIDILFLLLLLWGAQALVSFKKYMPPPLPYFKVNICPFSLPHFASIFFAYLRSFH